MPLLGCDGHEYLVGRDFCAIAAAQEASALTHRQQPQSHDHRQYGHTLGDTHRLANIIGLRLAQTFADSVCQYPQCHTPWKLSAPPYVTLDRT